MHRWFAALVVVAATTAGLCAQTLIVPAAASVDGVNGTRWRTDLQIKAEGGADAAFTLELLATGADNTDPSGREYTVAAGESVRLADVLGTQFGFAGTGALRLIVRDGRIVVSSRTYNDGTDGTFGQSVPAVIEHDALVHGVDATLIQLSRSPDTSAGYRSNLGVVNLTGSRLAARIALFRADGTAIGTLKRTLKPHEHRQINDVFRVAGAEDVDDGYAVVRTTTEDGRFVSYASVVDNASGDAVFLLAQVPQAPLEPRLVVLEHFMTPG